MHPQPLRFTFGTEYPLSLTLTHQSISEHGPLLALSLILKHATQYTYRQLKQWLEPREPLYMKMIIRKSLNLPAQWKWSTKHSMLQRAAALFVPY